MSSGHINHADCFKAVDAYLDQSIRN